MHYIPTRYPYTYAADFLRTNSHIIPSDVWEQARLKWGLETRLGLSRAEASAIRRLWAECTGQTDEELARRHADDYLIGHGIEPEEGS